MVKLWKLVVAVEPSMVVVVPVGVATTVPPLALNVPLFVKFPEKVRGLAEEASKVPALVILPVTLVVGSFVFRSKVPAVTVKVPPMFRVPLGGRKVEPEPLKVKLL